MIVFLPVARYLLKISEKYQLNGYIDYYNPVEPSTTSCPYLPGHEVNILEVPVQMKGPGRPRSTSSTLSTIFTLNPEDKFITPKPPPRTSCLGRSSSTSSRSASFEVAKVKVESSRDFEMAYYSEPVSTRSSFQMAFTQLQRSKSAQGDVSPAQRKAATEDLSNIIGSVDVIPSQMPEPQCNPSRLRIKDVMLNTKHLIEERFDLPTSLRNSTVTAIATTDLLHYPAKSLGRLPSMRSICLNDGEKCAHISTQQTTLSVEAKDLNSQLDKLHLDSPHLDIVDQVQQNLPSGAGDSRIKKSMSIDSNQRKSGQNLRIRGSSEEAFDESIHTYLNITLNRTDQMPQFNIDCSSSLASSQFLSPTLSFSTLADLISPSQLSQPDTPMMSEFGDDGLGLSQSTAAFQSPIPSYGLQRDSTPRATVEPSGFEGYCLPEVEQASTLTLRNLPAMDTNQHDSESIYEQKSRKYLVESWNDGSENPKSAVDDIFEDLSYLGRLIH